MTGFGIIIVVWHLFLVLSPPLLHSLRLSLLSLSLYLSPYICLLFPTFLFSPYFGSLRKIPFPSYLLVSHLLLTPYQLGL